MNRADELKSPRGKKEAQQATFWAMSKSNEHVIYQV